MCNTEIYRFSISLSQSLCAFSRMNFHFSSYGLVLCIIHYFWYYKLRFNSIFDYEKYKQEHKNYYKNKHNADINDLYILGFNHDIPNSNTQLRVSLTLTDNENKTKNNHKEQNYKDIEENKIIFLLFIIFTELFKI